MKILIPTDFSQLSKIAIQYAVGLSKDIELHLVLLHAIDTSTPAMARISSKKLEEAIKKSAEENMQELVKSIKKDNSYIPKISSKIVFGNVIEEVIESYSLKSNMDMICIGTKGASGIKKVLVGSNAARIIENSSIPVLTIPEFARYRGIKNIVYSSDLFNLDEELEVIIPFAKLMNARVYILHIKDDNEDNKRNLDFKNQEKQFRELFSYRKIDFKELDDVSIVHGINRCVADVNGDIVTMFTNRINSFMRLFRKSHTKNTAFQTKTPLLTFQKE